MFKVFSRHTVQFSRSIFELSLKFFSSLFDKKRDYVAEFENAFAKYIGAKYVFGVSSGRDALSLILDALDFENGAEIIISDYNFPPIPLILKRYGLIPVFIDICPDTHNIDASLIEEKITARTKAILITHLFGQPCKMDVISEIARRNRLIVIEDCAHSLGSEYKGEKTGNFGDASYFSFGPGKNFPCFGGGMVLSNDNLISRKIENLYERLPTLPFSNNFKDIQKTFLFYSLTNRRIFPFLTYPLIYLLSFLGSDLVDRLLEERFGTRSLSVNSKYRISNLQAVAGLSQLAFLKENDEKRIKNANLLNDKLRFLKKVKIVESIGEARNIYLYYRVLAEEREDFRKKLLKRGIDTKRDDMQPCSKLPFFANEKKNCPVSSGISHKACEIPCNSFMNKQDILYIAEQISDYCLS